MQVTNHANLPAAIVQAVVNDPYPHGKTGDISLTKLIGPPQIRVLERLYAEEIEEDAADRIWALLGQVTHGILERAESLAVTEQRLFADLEGWRISGQFDRLTVLPDGSMQDYKLTSAWSVIDPEPKPEWVAQLNGLRWLAQVNGYPHITRLEIVAILRDWSRGKARQGGDYPTHPVKVVPVPLWSSEETETYLTERVHLHQLADHCAATGRALPQCSDAERWSKPTTYAVRKPARKTALRVFDDRAAADRLAAETPSGYVEVRPGESVRCADYCPVARFCQQWADMNQRAAA